jgi:hypothetical protein
MGKTITQKLQVSKNMQAAKNQTKADANPTSLHPIAPSNESIEIIMSYSAITKPLQR